MASTTTPTPDAPPAPARGTAAAGFELDDAEEVALPEVLVVEVGEARVAMPVELTREVLRLRGATRVPGAPAWLIGLLNVRGAVVAAGDLALLAGGAAAAGPVVLVEADGRRAGLRVDAVIGVHTAELTGSGEGKTDGAGLPSAGVARLTTEAVTRAGQAAVPLLDLHAVLDAILEGDPSL